MMGIDDHTPIRSRSERPGTSSSALSNFAFILAGILIIFSLGLLFLMNSTEARRRRSESDLAKANVSIAELEQRIDSMNLSARAVAADKGKAAAELRAYQDQLAKAANYSKSLEQRIRTSEAELASANETIETLMHQGNKSAIEKKPVETQKSESKVLYNYECSIKKTGKPVDGYEKHIVNGFTLLISTETLEQSEKLDKQPLGCIEEEIRTIVARLPEKHVKALRKVPIWVEWNHTVPEKLYAQSSSPLAVYYGTVGESLLYEGVDPRKSKCVTIMTTKNIYQLKSTGQFPTTVLLHELAHAVHDLNIDFDNPVVDNAYKQAMSRDLYKKVKTHDGRKIPGYASKSSHEYFAELSTCYLDRIYYEPFDAKGLREYDSVGYELMTKVWGTVDQIEKAKKEDEERKNKLKVKK